MSINCWYRTCTATGCHDIVSKHLGQRKANYNYSIESNKQDIKSGEIIWEGNSSDDSPFFLTAEFFWSFAWYILSMMEVFIFLLCSHTEDYSAAIANPFLLEKQFQSTGAC